MRRKGASYGRHRCPALYIPFIRKENGPCRRCRVRIILKNCPGKMRSSLPRLSKGLRRSSGVLTLFQALANCSGIIGTIFMAGDDPIERSGEANLFKDRPAAPVVVGQERFDMTVFAPPGDRGPAPRLSRNEATSRPRMKERACRRPRAAIRHPVLAHGRDDAGEGTAHPGDIGDPGQVMQTFRHRPAARRGPPARQKAKVW